MSLADELFSCLDAGTSEGRQSADHARGRREHWRPGDEHGNPRGAGRNNGSGYGSGKHGGDGWKGGGAAAVGTEATNHRRHERRSSSVSVGREPAQHAKHDRSEDVGSRFDFYPGRNFDEHSKQSRNFNNNAADENGRKNYRSEEGPRHKSNHSGFDSRHRFDHKSTSHLKETSGDLFKKNSHSLVDKNSVESNTAQESRKPVKKFTKSDNCSDNVPFKLINYKKLEELVNGTPTELLVALANRHSGFENRLRETLSPDYIMLIMKSLAKLCRADFHENKVGILSQACEPEFLNQVSDYLKKLPFEGDENRRSRMEEFLTNILTFSRTTLDLLPDKACDKLPDFIETTDRAMRCIEACQAIKFPDALNEGFVDLDCRLKVRISEREKGHKKPSASNNAVVDDSPPDDFREINIFPTPRDILSSDAAFIRPNIVKGAYSSVEHYLDVQFRLLREDFVCPLREGITDYMSNTSMDGRHKKRINNVRIYRKVRFVAPSVVNDVVGLDVCFDPSNNSANIKWEHNKRFMFGSLLCFSNDNFASIFFGTVVKRDLPSLKKGIITVELCNVEHITTSMFQVEFIMAESEVYFEPYYHVLNALQKLQPDAFPMRQYIIDVDTESAPPAYVQTQPDFKFNIEGRDVSILDDSTWPTAEQLHLDHSQYVAFKSALTKEFVVIQGPPGTGKTYIGLKIVEALLTNSPIWNESKKPILVVCYTNHALDQFLEGILQYTKYIVRVGGQSKSESMSEYNLKELRRKNVHNTDTSMLMRDIHSSMSSIMRDIKLIQMDLESINSGTGVISLRVLKAGDIPKHHLSNFFDSDGKINDELFVEWLEIGMQYPDDFQSSDARVNVGPATETPEIESAMPEGDPNEGLWQTAVDDSIDFVFDPTSITTHVKFALSLNAIRDDISGLHEKRAKMDADHNPALRKQCFQLDSEIKEYHNCLNYWHNCLRSVGRHDDETAKRLLRGENLWQLSPNERWIIYSYWVNNLKRRLLSDLRMLEHQLRVDTKRYKEVQQIGDSKMMKNALVVGMTTTGAARLQPLLQGLKPRIVIVEEAAEVMESHIVVSLTNECQHLILIGDHKQLRPSTAVYKLAREYKFDMSLFERMINNGMHCETLKVQHRMRPEIAQLIVPSIYPELHDHPSVLEYKPVRGTTKSLYFVSHSNPEDEVCSFETDKDRSDHPGGNGQSASGTSNLGSALAVPTTSASVQQNGLPQSYTVKDKSVISEESATAGNEKVTVQGSEFAPSAASTRLQQKDLDQVCPSARIEGKSEERSLWAVKEVQNTSAAVNVSATVQSSELNKACSSQQNIGSSETEFRSKFALDQKTQKVDGSSRLFNSLADPTLERNTGHSIDVGRRESQAADLGGSELALGDCSVDVATICTANTPDNHTLEYEEIYSRLGDVNLSFLSRGGSNSRKVSRGDSFGEKLASPTGNSTVFNESGFQLDSGLKCAESASGGVNLDCEVNKNTDNPTDNVGLHESGLEHAVTVWAAGSRGRLVPRPGVKSSKAGPHGRAVLRRLRQLQARNAVLHGREMHQLKMKLDLQKHEQEVELLRLQQEYWTKKLSGL